MKNSINQTRILVAEDERLLLVMLANSLEAAGYSVLKAENGKDALQLCFDNQPDLAILDINMPKMSGLKVGEQLKLHTDIPFMFLTAYSGEDFVENANLMGAIGFLVKPLLLEQILPEIKFQIENIRDKNERNKSEEKMKQALESNKNINLAVGILMERYHLDADTAFEKIRSLSRSKRCKIHQIAQEFLNNNRSFDL